MCASAGKFRWRGLENCAENNDSVTLLLFILGMEQISLCRLTRRLTVRALARLGTDAISNS